jgi:hypothetical protein
MSTFSYVGAPLSNYTSKDVAITQRPTSTAILAIDSEDRYKTYAESRRVPEVGQLSNRSPYNFTINKSESILNGFFTRLALTEICFPWVIPNINRKTSKVIVLYNVGAGPVSTVVDLDIGFYNPSALASTLQTEIRAINPGLNVFTMTYGVSPAGNLPAFQYATNNATTVGFAPIATTPALNITNTTKQLFDLLGFDDSNQILATSYQGGLTYVQATRYIDIVCSQLTNNQALKDAMSQEVNRTLICRLYLGEPAGSQSTVSASSSTFCPPGCAPFTIYRDYTTPKQIAWLPNQPVGGFLQFQVYDDNEDILSEADSFSVGSNHCDWSMTLLITEN